LQKREEEECKDEAEEVEFGWFPLLLFVEELRDASNGWPRAGGKASLRTVPRRVTQLPLSPSRAKICVLGRNDRLLLTKHLATASCLRPVPRSEG